MNRPSSKWARRYIRKQRAAVARQVVNQARRRVIAYSELKKLGRI